jgi:protein-L-isoaspartate(D-aspartate) O-methyltransferase
MDVSAAPPDPRRSAMVERQLRRRGIADERVLAAMERVPRELFVPAALRPRAYDDEALPIGEGQTISQPFVVATMLTLLRPRAGERGLDVGTGSGYAAALMAALGVEVLGIERLPVLADRARAALAAAGFPGVEVRVGDGRLGAPERAPFDVIAVAAATADVPVALVEQLADGGRLVVPRGDEWGQVLVLLERRGDALVERRSLACRFVPLVGHG